MNWRGKMIGGSLGSLLGPWGTLAGAAVGHLFVDRKDTQAAEKEALRLLAVAASALFELAESDGRYTAREDKAIRGILAELNQNLGTRLSAHDLAFLVDDASRIDRSLARLAALARANRGLGRAAAAWLWRVAVSDSDPTPEETERIAGFAHHAGLSDEEQQQASRLYVRVQLHATGHERREACHTLGVPYHADAAALKNAYRTLSLKYHPDKHADLDPDIRALTAEKFAQIKAAYDLLSGSAPAAGEWYAKPASGPALAPAAGGEVALCFICGQKVRLPEAEHIASARCPVCQTLLALDRPLAEQLA